MGPRKEKINREVTEEKKNIHVAEKKKWLPQTTKQSIYIRNLIFFPQLRCKNILLTIQWYHEHLIRLLENLPVAQTAKKFK